MSTAPAPKGGENAPAFEDGVNECFFKHKCSPVPSYDTGARKVNRASHARRFSPVPVIVVDLTHETEGWPVWSYVPIEDLDLDLFDESGNPIHTNKNGGN